MRISKSDAKDIAARYHFPLDCDFHTLPSGQVERVLDAAHEYGYRRPRNANGSRARYFHAYLQRRAREQDIF